MWREYLKKASTSAAHSDRCRCELCCNGTAPTGGRQLPRVVSWMLRAALAVGAILWQLLRRSRPGQYVDRRWGGLSPSRRRVVLACCGAMAVAGMVVSYPDRGEGQRHLGRAMEYPAMGRIKSATQPLVVHVDAGSATGFGTLSPGKQRALVKRATEAILSGVKSGPRRLVVIALRDVPLSFAELSTSDRQRIESRLGSRAAARYEIGVASFIAAVIEAVQRKNSSALLSVLGLPVEPEDVGADLSAVQPTNDRYRRVIDRLGPFVPARRFVVLGSSLDERKLARMGMRETLRLRQGRPIVFQTNRTWRALIGTETLVQDVQFTARLAE